eukprot:1158818-Pelagomonas_calceolata.AAC.9
MAAWKVPCRGVTRKRNIPQTCNGMGAAPQWNGNARAKLPAASPEQDSMPCNTLTSLKQFYSAVGGSKF